MNTLRDLGLRFYRLSFSKKSEIAGRLSLLVGLIVLSSCLLLGWLFARKLDEGPFPDILRESFLILGWVAIWKPSEIFLYAWPPLVRRRKLFRRLSRANVRVEVGPSG